MLNDSATALLQERGRLSQRCPSCGIVEAAGAYCSKCLTPTGPATFFTQAKGKPPASTERPVVRHSAAKRIGVVSQATLTLWAAL